MVKISTSIAIEAGKEYTCIKDGLFEGIKFEKGKVYGSEVKDKLQTYPNGVQVHVDEEHFELYDPSKVGHMCKHNLYKNGEVVFENKRLYMEVSHGIVTDETGKQYNLGPTCHTNGDTFYNTYFNRVLAVEGELPQDNNSFDKERPEPGQVFNPQAHYNNENGSLYKIAGDFGLNAYEFDILKRLTRCRKKGQFAEDLQKIKDTVDLYLLEQGGKHVQLHNRDTAGSDSTDKEPVPKQG